MFGLIEFLTNESAPVYMDLHEARQLLREARQTLREEERVKHLLNAEEVAEALGVSKRTLEDLVDAGEIEPLWIRSCRRFEPEEVRRFIETRPRSRRQP